MSRQDAKGTADAVVPSSTNPAAAAGAGAQAQVTPAINPATSWVGKFISALAALGITYTTELNVCEQLCGPGLEYETQFNQALRDFYNFLVKIDAEGIITTRNEKENCIALFNILSSLNSYCGEKRKLDDVRYACSNIEIELNKALLVRLTTNNTNITHLKITVFYLWKILDELIGCVKNIKCLDLSAGMRGSFDTYINPSRPLYEALKGSNTICELIPSDGMRVSEELQAVFKANAERFAKQQAAGPVASAVDAKGQDPAAADGKSIWKKLWQSRSNAVADSSAAANNKQDATLTMAAGAKK